MTNFDDLARQIPEPDPITGRLFAAVIKHPEAAQAIKSILASITFQVINRGGRISISAEGPDQGITVEVDGKVFRLSPCSSNDPEEQAVSKKEHRAIVNNEETDPIAINMTALRNLLMADSKLRGR